jgi:hypothetical protein
MPIEVTMNFSVNDNNVTFIQIQTFFPVRLGYWNMIDRMIVLIINDD